MHFTFLKCRSVGLHALACTWLVQINLTFFVSMARRESQKWYHSHQILKYVYYVLQPKTNIFSFVIQKWPIFVLTLFFLVWLSYLYIMIFVIKVKRKIWRENSTNCIKANIFFNFFFEPVSVTLPISLNIVLYIFFFRWTSPCWPCTWRPGRRGTRTSATSSSPTTSTSRSTSISDYIKDFRFNFGNATFLIAYRIFFQCACTPKKMYRIFV